KLRLVLFGMYLHYVVDSFVHPDRAVPGHLFEEHQTDLIPNQPLEFAKAAAKSYRLLLDNQSFLAPDGLANRDALVGRYNLESEQAQEGFFANAVKAIADAYDATDPSGRGKHLLERAGALGYQTQGLPRANPELVKNNLDLLWLQVVTPALIGKTTGADISLGEQRHPPVGQIDEPAFINYAISPATGDFTITIPGGDEWHTKSFIQYVREDRGDGLDDLREQMRAELVNQFQETLKTASSVFHPARAARDLSRATLNIIVGGSGSSAERIGRSDWSPDAASISPKFDPRKIVVEVGERGWATDGLAKYLKPPAPPPQPNEIRIHVEQPAALAQPEVRQQIERAVAESPRATVIIESQHLAPDATAQNQEIAKAVEDLARSHAQAHPDGEHTLYVEGAGADVLRPVEGAAPGGVAPIFQTPPVVVQPIDPPASLPQGAEVVLTRSPFMDFDPGSPGYQRLKTSVESYGRVAAGVAVVESGDASPTARPAGTEPRGAPAWEYYPRGATEPIRLSNSRPAEVLAASRSSLEGARQIVERIVQNEEAAKPSSVGGISLVTPATPPPEVGKIVGATYDPGESRIVLRAEDGSLWRLPPTDPQLTRAAYDCLYKRGVAPELSIGVNPKPNEVEPHVGVFYLSAIEGTRLGHVMLESDELLGRLAFGGSDDLRALGLSQLNIHTLAELYPDHYADTPGNHLYYGAGRVYLVPSLVSLAAQSRGELRFDETRFDVRFEPMGAAESEFVSSIVSNWGKIVASPGAQPFQELTQAAQVVAVFNWLHERGVPFDDSLESVALEKNVLTPTSLPRGRAPSRESLSPTLPLTQYGVNGIERVYDAEGRMTRLVYRGGRVASVERKDGAKLDVYTDALGEVAAVSLGGDLGAAFDSDKRGGRSRFFDRVRLRVVNGKYVGYETTPQTRALYDVNPDDIVSAIVANFIAEAHAPAAAATGVRGAGGARRAVVFGVAAVAVPSLALLLYLRARRRRVRTT
ncbi:MAG: hypothetical protein LC746_18070, partial [Acidobacteria bacterium]|nr:hypothetical protein [Acidobacteriota bacterium]